MSAFSFFHLSVDGAVAHLVLNRPEKANGMNEAFWTELPAIIRTLDADHTVRALVISGAGKHFSAGMDLSAFDFIREVVKAEPARAAYALRQEILRLQDSFNALEQCRFPIIAAIHGACLGGAVDLISACDIRLAAIGATFAIEEIHVGMAADVGTLQRLPRLIPPGIVKELAFTGRRFSADEAKTWGLLNAVHIDQASTIGAALALARDIAAKSPIAIAGIKRAIDYARDHTVADALEQMATWNSAMLRPDDLNSAMEARMAKQEAVFADLLKHPRN